MENVIRIRIRYTAQWPVDFRTPNVIGIRLIPKVVVVVAVAVVRRIVRDRQNRVSLITNDNNEM